MVSIFHKDYLEKPIVISAPQKFALPIAKPTVKLSTKRK